MIKENQDFLSRLNIISDLLITYLLIPFSFWIRFYVLPYGKINFSLQRYLLIGVVFVLLQMGVFFAFGLYRPMRHIRARREIRYLISACLLEFVLLLSWLSLAHEDDYSRQMLLLFFVFNVGMLCFKRIIIRLFLRSYRAKGYNLKYVVIIGGGRLASDYLQKIQKEAYMGYSPKGYVANTETNLNIPYLGTLDELESILEKTKPDEIISAVDPEDFQKTPFIIDASEKFGCKMSIVPLYAEYMSGHPQFDDFDGLPLLNIRRIPLDNKANAAVKRLFDILFSASVLIIFSPLLLFTAIGVKLSSPGPIIFKQERIGRNKTPFMMYKFRSMRVNVKQDTGWSSNEDNRKTAFGSFIRKYSIDEFPQFWNVLKGDMSIIGPRPEVPFHVDHFKDEVPRYMLKHLVRPGITGWAQVNDLRGDTSIPERVKYDIFYIENWSIGFDLKILFMTVFGGKFKNNEILSR